MVFAKYFSHLANAAADMTVSHAHPRCPDPDPLGASRESRGGDIHHSALCTFSANKSPITYCVRFPVITV